MSLRIVFMGTPEFSVPVLEALKQAGHEIVACYTQPPRPAGRRGLELVASPVQQAAEKMGIEVYSPISLKSPEDQNLFQSHQADAAIVVAYGLLLPETILAAPKYGCFNAHASLLPRWRGAAPIQRAIMAGDGKSGVMVMKMDTGLDTGPVALSDETKIDETTDAGQLHDTLSAMSARLMVEAMSQLEAGTLTLTPQRQEGVTYATKISKDETRIDWQKPAPDVHRHIMGLAPFPGAWCEMPLGGKSARVKILSARPVDRSGVAGTALDDQLTIACKTGAVQLLRLQKAGSKAMNAKEFLQGSPLAAGMELT